MARGRGSARTRPSRAAVSMEVFEGNPVGKWAWNNVWKLPPLKRGKSGEPCTFGDIANIFRTNIEQASHRAQQ